MATQEHTDLIFRVLDGEATADDRARLDELRGTDPRVDELFNDLKTTDLVMARVGSVEPPARLASSIMAALPAERYARRPSRAAVPLLSTLRSALGDFFRARPAVAFAYAMVLGAVIGMAAFASLAGGPTQPSASDVFATMVAPEDVRDVTTVDARVLAIEGAEAVLTVRAAAENVFLEVDIPAASPVGLRFAFDHEQLVWLGINPIEGSGLPNITTDQGSVQIASEAPSHFILGFAALVAPAEIEAEIIGDGGSSGPHSLVVGRR